VALERHKLNWVVFRSVAFSTIIFIMKHFANTDPVGLLCLRLLCAGIAAYIYTLLPERFTQQKAYTVRQT